MKTKISRIISPFRPFSDRKQLLLLLISLNVFMYAQTSGWQWARSGGGANQDQSQGICSDASGNLFVAGNFVSSLVTIGSTTLTNLDNTAQSADVFIAKYDASGNVLWAKSFGGKSNEAIAGICTDAGGNLLLLGSLYGPSLAIGATTLTNQSAYTDIFLAKFDPSGNLLWAKPAGGNDDDYPRGIAADASGNLFISGYFTGPAISFGSTTLTNTSNYPDGFVTKYDASGNVLWAKKLGGSKAEYCGGVSSDAGGNAFVVGTFESPSLNFGSSPLTNSGNTADVFIVKYDALGNEIWGRKSSGPFGWLAGGGSVTTDAAGNILITGPFSSSVIAFGTTTLTMTPSQSASVDLYLVKYDASGNMLWAKSAGGNKFDFSNGISTDAQGNVFITGSFEGSSITFDSQVLSKGISAASLFVAKYDPSGNVLWVQGATTNADNGGAGVCATSAGDAVITGNFGISSIAFGSHTLTPVSTSTTSGNGDFFVAKIGGAGPITGLKENNLPAIARIFPNPFSTRLILETEYAFTKANLKITDDLGKVIRQIDGLSGQSFILQRDDLPPGVYFIHLSEENRIILSEKVIVTDH